jgi:hypothetical protein
MAARRSAARGRKRGGNARAALARIERELPRNLGDFRKLVSKQLNQLERQMEKTGQQTRRRAVRLLREASRELGRLDAHGERGWRQLAAPYRKELVSLLRRIEKAVAPKPAAPRAKRKPAAARPAAAPPSAPPSQSSAA